MQERHKLFLRPSFYLLLYRSLLTIFLTLVLILFFHHPLPWLLALGLLLDGARRIYYFVKKQPHLACWQLVHDSHHCQLRSPSGGVYSVTAVRVWRYLMVLYYRQNAYLPGAKMVFFDMLSADDFRRLRQFFRLAFKPQSSFSRD